MKFVVATKTGKAIVSADDAYQDEATQEAFLADLDSLSALHSLKVVIDDGIVYLPVESVDYVLITDGEATIEVN